MQPGTFLLSCPQILPAAMPPLAWPRMCTKQGRLTELGFVPEERWPLPPFVSRSLGAGRWKKEHRTCPTGRTYRTCRRTCRTCRTPRPPRPPAQAPPLSAAGRRVFHSANSGCERPSRPRPGPYFHGHLNHLLPPRLLRDDELPPPPRPVKHAHGRFISCCKGLVGSFWLFVKVIHVVDMIVPVSL